MRNVLFGGAAAILAAALIVILSVPELVHAREVPGPSYHTVPHLKLKKEGLNLILLSELKR